jgi:hypothetical protein
MPSGMVAKWDGASRTRRVRQSCPTYGSRGTGERILCVHNRPTTGRVHAVSLNYRDIAF